MSKSLEISDISDHPIKQIEINQLDYYYIDKGEGDVLFLLHGFPDLANTWDESITALSKSYRCIAPFLRGYYPTSIPKDGDYTMKSVASDILEMAQKLGIETFSVIGHDWGASVTYAMANLAPEKIKKIVTVAIPHPAYIKPNLTTFYKARHFLRFRNEKKSPTFTRKNNFAYLDTLYTRWAPNWSAYPETARQVKETFKQEGRLEAALGYYWSFHRTLGDRELQSFYGKRPKMPLLAFAGKTDGALLLKPFYQMEKTLPCKIAVHEQAGHFLHREAHDFFIDGVLRFLEN